MIWGESNSRNFLQWADYCRSNALKERGITNTVGPNFTTDRNSVQYQQAKEDLLNAIQKSLTISVQQLYNTLPGALIANPTLKNVLLQLFLEDNIQIQAQGSSLSERETNYTLVFVKKATKSPPKPNPSFVGDHKQSNIEDLIDNDWKATGRKLDFDPKTQPKRENLNVSLKRTPRPTVATPAVKPVIDLPKPVQQEVPQAPPVITTPKVEIPVQNQNITYIEIPKPKPKEVEVPPAFIPELKPRPIVKQPEPIADLTIFYGLTALQLYFIEAFLRDALRKETDPGAIKELKELVKSKADRIYLENKVSMNIGLKILVGLSCFILIGFIIIAINSQNKVRNQAVKSYQVKYKELGYETLKTKLREKYPKIIKF
ncbi:hypothetical protein SCLARK_00300 [Spiroplasma clarkii]|uniref:Uncharacterized protein n=1 Tax=Spiroplasma clarkii TaxID=2139 RepID=A0A1Y0KZ98_9MOLU|nr:hypothetical protein [Spiroplasma clarkii]ARU91057.1 hypothetical protein SCLARK_00300 [Spiroplasma clarkii]ATX70493.1 hypothetical protein SCLAR_v1c01620 [Spiroplasma clarkii]